MVLAAVQKGQLLLLRYDYQERIIRMIANFPNEYLFELFGIIRFIRPAPISDTVIEKHIPGSSYYKELENWGGVRVP